MLKAIISFILYTFIFYGFISIVCCVLLHFKPNSTLAFKILAYCQAPFFGLSSNYLANVCNLNKNCKYCRYWTCSKCGK